MILIVLCAMATSAFFLPLRTARDQYFPDNHVCRVLEIAQDTSQSVDWMCGFPLVVRVLFFLPALS